ncbi:ribonuclease H-like domain-containing protein [Tanacetum coccineum]|uniref:Ribonuclease H-like domain-containing protein n=1 Tax=Tanacetum coccineum TaxID=301880 RepID=A0ABQ4WKC0_9ASTR
MSVHNSEHNSPLNFDHDDDFHDFVTRISKLDISDPLHLHPNDTTALIVVSIKLKGTENYQVWSCAMFLALEGKNKIGFIDGSCKRSNTDEVLGKQWDMVNNGSFIADYYHKLNALWKQYDGMIELPKCVCNASEETLPDVRSAYATISSEESHIVAVGSIVGSSQRNQASAFVSNLSHPNGMSPNISKIGILICPNGLWFDDVEVIPEYCVTLISLHKLVKENKACTTIAVKIGSYTADLFNVLKEMNALLRNGTWELVELPEGRKGAVKTVKVDYENQIADILTKGLDTVQHLDFVIKTRNLIEGDYLSNNAHSSSEHMEADNYMSNSASEYSPSTTHSVTVMDHSDFQDGFGKVWDSSMLSKIVEKEVRDHAIDMIITFDSYGVSGSSMFQHNPASKRSRFTTPSSPFGNPSQESQPVIRSKNFAYLDLRGVRSCYDEEKRVAETLMFDYHRQHGIGNMLQLHMTELITLNLICPSTHQLLQSSGGDSGPDMSFDKSASQKSGFFLIDRRAIPGSMVWRYPSAAIDDPRPATGSFSMADLRRLSAC